MVLKRKIAFIDLSKNSVEIAPVPKPQCVKVCTPGAIQIIK